MALESPLRGYELLERIGVGAASVIYRAQETASGNVVAIKHVSIEGRENSKYLRHIRNEYETLRGLQDGPEDSPPEGIIRVHCLVRRGRFRRRKECVLVMDYVDGPDLRRERRYPLGQMIDIMSQSANAISHLHRRGILHGDLKPENILVGSRGRVTLIDFGFSCRTGLRAHSIRGTRDYMAPEQIDMGCLTERTDIYNFGATMYFLVTGRHIPSIMPAQGDVADSVWHRAVKPQAPRALNPNVPFPLDRMIMHCVNKDAFNRPSHMEEVLDALSKARDLFLD